MKYSKKYLRDYDWYISVLEIFNFDGSLPHTNKKGEPIVVSDSEGVEAKKSFYMWDTNGKIVPMKEPDLLHKLLVTKGSVNLHIKMYAEDRAKGYLLKIEFDKICHELNVPQWFIDAVERQKYKYYDKES